MLKEDVEKNTCYQQIREVENKIPSVNGLVSNTLFNIKLKKLKIKYCLLAD